MVRILMCATEAPLPPLGGLRLQLNHLCRELAARHEICVLAYRSHDQAGEPPPGVELLSLDRPVTSTAARVRNWARALATRQPRGATAVTPSMTSAVRALLAEREFDLVHVAAARLAGLAPALDGLPAVLAALDAWHLNAQAETALAPRALRILYRLDERSIRRFGATAYRPYQRILLVTQEDADAVRELDPTLAVEAIPNGLDSDYFGPNPEVAREPGLVVLTGTMDWAPNVQAAELLARRVLPALRARQPHARVTLVGRRPSAAVRGLGELDGVEVVGDVPDVRPWLWRAEVYACPMAGGTGIKNKLLEALSCGAPCVATSRACRGLDVTPGEELSVADADDEFAAAVAALMDDESARSRLAAAGRSYVRARHSWAEVAAAYERAYERAAAAWGDSPARLSAAGSPPIGSTEAH